VRYARDFADRRRVGHGQTAMNRLYVAESSPTATGTVADHRLRLRPSQLGSVVLALAAELGVVGASGASGVSAPALEPALAKWVATTARDLARIAAPPSWSPETRCRPRRTRWSPH